MQELAKRVETDQPNQEANISNSSAQSQRLSTHSSIEGIALTPPATPSPNTLDRLLEPNPWLNKISFDLDAVLTNEPVAPVISRNLSSSAFEGPNRPRSHSLSYAEGILHCTNDPFDTDWSMWTADVSGKAKEGQHQQKKKKNMNPFIPNSPDTPKIKELGN